jgi:phosphoadenosine phosphosulfate reductase
MRPTVDRDLVDMRRAAEALDGLGLVRAALASPLGDRLALVSSFGAESAVLLDMVASVAPATPVIFLDTGHLFPETLDYQRSLCAHLGLSDVRHVRPDPAALARHDPLGERYRDDADLCCHLRKTEPLEQALHGFAGWITGRKRFQGGARADLPLVETEPTTGRLKINPLAHWSLEDIRHYRRLRQLPLHPLLPKGFSSVGCRPCTTPAGPGESPRAGRWRGLDKQECGIHRN